MSSLHRVDIYMATFCYGLVLNYLKKVSAEIKAPDKTVPEEKPNPEKKIPNSKIVQDKTVADETVRKNRHHSPKKNQFWSRRSWHKSNRSIAALTLKEFFYSKSKIIAA